MATVGIHLIWATYGTWLPGDSRGHWSPLFDFYGQLVERGGKLNRDDLVTRQLALQRMTEPAKILNDEEMKIVADTLETLVQRPNQKPSEPDLPRVYAAAIEKTHVHLLLGPIRESIGTAVGRFKGKTSSAVLALPANQGRKHIWTAKYWKVFLFDAIALEAVKRYIEDHNVRRGCVPFAWISAIEM